MLLESFLPQLPSSNLELTIYIVGALGVILLIYSQFVEAENRRDLVRMVGAAGLEVYSLYILDPLFIITAGGIFLASLIEFIEIYLGLHQHTHEEIKKYKDLGGWKIFKK